MSLNIPRSESSQSTGPVNIQNFGTVPVSSPEYVAYLFDISSNGRYAPLDHDLQQIALNLQNTDFGAQAQLMLVDLIRILAFIRKQNQELSTQSSNLAFTSAISTAGHQKQQAAKQAMAERINGAISIYQGVTEMGSGLYQMASSANAYSDAKKEITTLHQQNATSTAAAAADADGPAEFTRPSGSPPPYSAKATEGLNFSEKGSVGSAGGASKAAEAKGAEVLPGDDEGTANATATQLDKKAIDQHLQDRMRNFHSEMEYKMRVVNGLTQVVSGIVKQFSAQQTMEAGQEQALATIEQAFTQYMNNKASDYGDYANEMREFIRGILDLLRSTEQARRQAAMAAIQIA